MHKTVRENSSLKVLSCLESVLKFGPGELVHKKEIKGTEKEVKEK